MDCRHMTEGLCQCFSFHSRLTVGTFAQQGLASSSLNHCGYTSSHPSHRRFLVAYFYVGQARGGITILSIWNASPRTFGTFSRGGTRLVTPSSLSSSMLSETPECRKTLVNNALSLLPAPRCTGSAHSQSSPSRGYGSDSGHTPFTSLDSGNSIK